MLSIQDNQSTEYFAPLNMKTLKELCLTSDSLQQIIFNVDNKLPHLLYVQYLLANINREWFWYDLFNIVQNTQYTCTDDQRFIPSFAIRYLWDWSSFSLEQSILLRNFPWDDDDFLNWDEYIKIEASHFMKNGIDTCLRCFQDTSKRCGFLHVYNVKKLHYFDFIMYVQDVDNWCGVCGKNPLFKFR